MNENLSCLTMTGLLNILQTTEIKLRTAIDLGYNRYKKYKNGKYRWIEEPNDDLKLIQGKLNEYLQEHLECPPYCMSGFKGRNNIKNANKHAGKREIITMDIKHCFPNTKLKYITDFFAGNLGARGKVLNLLTELATYNNYLPTGAPTSTILLAYIHKEIFDSIYKKMSELDIDMTLYVDDIVLSTHKHMGNWVITYVNKALHTHGLWLNKSKTKRYGYKYAKITGVYISQSKKLSAPFKIGYAIIKKLRTKEINQMSLTELRSILAKISYIQQFAPKKMQSTKNKVIKQIKILNKT